MGIIKLIKEMKKAEEFEKEVREKVALLDDPEAITIENLSLQIYVLENDIKRYRKREVAPSINNINWDTIATTLEGVVSFYNQVIENGISKMTDKRFLLLHGFKVLKHAYSLDDPDEQAFYMGRVRAIAGLTEKQLYYTWTNPKAPMVVNPKFVSACEKMGIK